MDAAVFFSGALDLIGGQNAARFQRMLYPDGVQFAAERAEAATGADSDAGSDAGSEQEGDVRGAEDLTPVVHVLTAFWQLRYVQLDLWRTSGARILFSSLQVQAMYSVSQWCISKLYLYQQHGCLRRAMASCTVVLPAGPALHSLRMDALDLAALTLLVVKMVELQGWEAWQEAGWSALQADMQHATTRSTPLSTILGTVKASMPQALKRALYGSDGCGPEAPQFRVIFGKIVESLQNFRTATAAYIDSTLNKLTESERLQRKSASHCVSCDTGVSLPATV